MEGKKNLEENKNNDGTLPGYIWQGALTCKVLQS